MKTSNIWRHNVRWMRNIPWTLDGLAEIQRSPLFAVNSTNPQEQIASATAWEDILEKRHPVFWRYADCLAESPLTPKEVCFEFRGRIVSLDFYKKLNLALEIIRKPVTRVLEIGAGWGQVARILHELRPEIQYVIIDLPESLQWAELYLGEHGIHAELVPAQDFRNVKGDFDCLVNSSSFGEMPTKVAAAYLQEFPIRRVKRMVLLNRLLNTYCRWREADRETEAAWYFHVDPDAACTQLEIEPDFTRIPGPESEINKREVFMVLEHGCAYLPSFKDIESQSWFARHNTFPSSRTSHILWPDKDVLKVLLEYVRMDWNSPQPYSAEVLDMLLCYLDAISLKAPFEEMPSLWAKYRQLTGCKHWSNHGTWSRPIRRLTTWASSRLWSIRNR